MKMTKRLAEQLGEERHPCSAHCSVFCRLDPATQSCATLNKGITFSEPQLLAVIRHRSVFAKAQQKSEIPLSLKVELHSSVSDVFAVVVKEK